MSILLATAVACVLVPLLLLASPVGRRHPGRNGCPVIAIVVLGDLARSPRMLYHAQSCIGHGRPIWLVGYVDTPLPPSLTTSPLLHIVRLAPPPDLLSRLPRALYLPVAALKLAWMSAVLLIALFSLSSPAYLLVQNPPALPTLPIIRFYTLLRRARLVIDWHNTGASVLALRFHSHHPAVRLASRLEATFGRHAYAHLFVTRAMRNRLSREWSLKGEKRVLYDRPPSHFRHLDPTEAEELLARLPFFADLGLPSRPALLVSSTSWTADEDFTLLLRALSLYDETARQPASALPPLLALVTGKGGSLRTDFERQAEELERTWQYTRARTAWLERGDYPLLLGAADLGVSLHASTSGFDLPMKAVDMFGCGLPVLALDFPALGELVQDGVNGRVFKTAEQLAGQLSDLLRGFPARSTELSRLREGITRPTEGASWTNWEESWNVTVAPLLGISSDSAR